MFRSTRRSILGLPLALALVAPPLMADAQPASVARIGYIVGGSRSGPPPPSDGFRQGLRDLGYVEGRDVVIEFRFADGRLDRFPELAADLVRLNVDVIVAPGTAAAQAARKASATIPIVTVTAADPIENGLIQSFARPGGTVTGLTMSPGPAMGGKLMALLKEAVPRLSRVAALTNPLTPPHADLVKDMESAARKVGVGFHPVAARRVEDIDGAFAAMSRARADGLIVLSDAMFDSAAVRARIRGMASRAR